jgi:hypothetical protein
MFWVKMMLGNTLKLRFGGVVFQHREHGEAEVHRGVCKKILAADKYLILDPYPHPSAVEENEKIPL